MRKHSDGHTFPSSLPSGKLNSLLLKMVIYSGFSHWKWWFSIAMLIYWRVMIKVSMSSTCADAVKQIPKMIIPDVLKTVSLNNRCCHFIIDASMAHLFDSHRMVKTPQVIRCWSIPDGVISPLSYRLYIHVIHYMGVGQNLLLSILMGWTSIYQLFWCSPGVQGFDTSPYVYQKTIHHQMIIPVVL